MAIKKLSRRSFSNALLALPFAGSCSRAPERAEGSEWTRQIRLIEDARGGRIGVAALDLETGKFLGYRESERFAMCSTFKWILGGIVLRRVAAGQESLSRQIAVTKDDIVPHAPTTEPAIGSSLSVEQLCAATIANSDNPAANLLLYTIGGPDGFTQHLREIGDETTRLDRYEPQLNANSRGDPQDTTTPKAMVELIEQMVFGHLLEPAFRDVLRNWMLETTTGAGRLSAGVPSGWRLGHKTGTSYRDANNDVGFALPPIAQNRKPVIVASFSDGPGALEQKAETAHADIAKQVFVKFI